MKKQSCFRIFGALIILVIVFCAFGHPMISLHNGRLKQAILATEGQESIHLNDIVPFDWDTLYTFDPYTSKEEIQETIGCKSFAIRETVSEGMVQLIFIKDNRVTASVCEYAENLGYQLNFQSPVTKEDDAVFSLSQQGEVLLLTEQ